MKNAPPNGKMCQRRSYSWKATVASPYSESFTGRDQPDVDARAEVARELDRAAEAQQIRQAAANQHADSKRSEQAFVVARLVGVGRRHRIRSWRGVLGGDRQPEGSAEPTRWRARAGGAACGGKYACCGALACGFCGAWALGSGSGSNVALPVGGSGAGRSAGQTAGSVGRWRCGSGGARSCSATARTELRTTLGVDGGLGSAGGAAPGSDGVVGAGAAGASCACARLAPKVALRNDSEHSAASLLNRSTLSSIASPPWRWARALLIALIIVLGPD